MSKYEDGTKLYHEMDWAAQRWDWFNEGRIVEPRSFCQFWRTVLLYATVALLLRPLERFLVSLPSLPNIPFPSALGPFIQAAGKGGWFVLQAGKGVAWFLWRIAGRVSWLLTYPLRLAARPTLSPVLATAVSAGRRIDTYGKQHRKGLDIFVRVLVAIYIATLVTVIATWLLLTSWAWTLIGVGAITVTGFAAYGFFKSGAPGLILDVLVLVSDAASAAKHGVCPPVRIIRRV